MTVYLDEDEYFSMNAYVQALGDQTIALSGYLVEHRSDGTYIAPLIPDLFYGVNGTQLSHSWRQNFTATGDQVILSRSGGQPSVPRQELAWRKISGNQVAKEGARALQPLPSYYGDYKGWSIYTDYDYYLWAAQKDSRISSTFQSLEGLESWIDQQEAQPQIPPIATQAVPYLIPLAVVGVLAVVAGAYFLYKLAKK